MIKFEKGLVAAVCLFLASCATDVGREVPQVVDVAADPVEDFDFRAFESYVAGQHARHMRDTDIAAGHYLETLKRDPRNISLMRNAFSLMITDGRYRDALMLAERLVEISPNTGVAQMLLALEDVRTGDYAQANDRLVYVKGTGFDTLVLPLMSAWVEAGKGDMNQAQKALDSLTRIAVFDSYRSEHVAYLYDFAKENEKAENAYIALVSNENLTSLQPVLAYGAFLDRAGRRGDARNLYDRFLEKFPDNRFLEISLARLESGRAIASPADKPAAALAAALFRAAADLSSDNARNPAILYARLATFADPGLEEAYLLLGNLLTAEGFTSAALRAFGEIPSDSPLASAARLRQAWALDSGEQTDEAIALLRDYLAVDPEDTDIRSTLGDILRTEERFEEALVEYNKSVEAIGEPAQGDWFLFFTRGIAYEQLDRWEEAEADFLKALELQPEEPQVLNYLGYSWIDRGMNMDEAQGMIEQAVEQRPNDGYIVDSLGWVLYLRGKYEKAAEVLERAVLLQPSDPTINDHFGDALWQIGSTIEARFQWNHALTLEPEEDQIARIRDKLSFGLALAGAEQR